MHGSLIITDTTQKYSDFSLSYLYDADSDMSIEKVSTLHFTQTIPSQFSLGYKEGSAWFKLTLHNKSKNSDFILHFTEPFWKVFDLFEPKADGWKRHPNGLSTPLKTRDIENASPAFSLLLQPDESKTYFIHAQTYNGQIGAFELYTEQEYFRPSRLTLDTVYLFYSGIFFIIMLLNLFLLVEMKERLYAYYIGYVFSFIVFVSMFSGSYLYLGLAPWNTGLHVVGTVVLAFMALFSKTYLELKTYFPLINRLFCLLTVIFLVLGILIHFSIPYSTLIFNIISSLFVILLLAIAIKTWLFGKIQTSYYLIALIIYMPAMAMMVLTFNGLLANSDFTRYTFLAGSLIEIIFFALILARRFHAAKDDTIRFQKALLTEKQNNQKILEQEVEKQKQEINEKNAILFHQSRHAAMGEMISMIAHQWRQPLNTLALINQDLYFTFQLGHLEPESFEKSHYLFNEHLQYMSKTIDDFRNFYRNDGTKRPEDIGEIAGLALSLSEVFLKYAKIKTDLIVTTEQKIFLAKNEMIQVLMNLIKNAHDAIQERRIKSGQITITIGESEESVFIRVCDNAGGVPDTIQTKIFDPYFSTKSENGTGLGLYMSKSIIEDHCQGTLTLDNTDSGACFVITIPITFST